MARKKKINPMCTCNHLDSEHFCSLKLHKQPGHDCETARTFCAGSTKGTIHEPWSCPCKHYKRDSLKYMEQIYQEGTNGK